MSSWGAWLNTIVKQSEDLFSEITSGVNEFVDEVAADAQELERRVEEGTVIEGVTETIKSLLRDDDDENQDDNEESNNGEGNTAPSRGSDVERSFLLDRKQAALDALRRDPATYTLPLSSSSSSSSSFNLSSHSDAIASSLAQFPDLRAMHATLVPTAVSDESFWMRYFARLNALEEEQSKRKLVLSHAGQFDASHAEADGWDIDDDISMDVSSKKSSESSTQLLTDSATTTPHTINQKDAQHSTSHVTEIEREAPAASPQMSLLSTRPFPVNSTVYSSSVTSSSSSSSVLAPVPSSLRRAASAIADDNTPLPTSSTSSSSSSSSAATASIPTADIATNESGPSRRASSEMSFEVVSHSRSLGTPVNDARITPNLGTITPDDDDNDDPDLSRLLRDAVGHVVVPTPAKRTAAVGLLDDDEDEGWAEWE